MTFRVLGPDGFGHRLELPPIVLVHPLFVAQLKILQVIGFRAPGGGAPPAPLAVSRAIDVLNEVGHVLRALAQVERRDTQASGRAAEVQEVQDAPTIGRIGIPRAPVRRPLVGRANHLLPTILRVVDHRAAVAQDGDALIDQRLSHVLAHRQILEPPPLARLEKGITEGDE